MSDSGYTFNDGTDIPPSAKNKQGNKQLEERHKPDPYDDHPYNDYENDRRTLIYNVAEQYLRCRKKDEQERDQLAIKTARRVYNYEHKTDPPTEVNDVYIKRTAEGMWLDSLDMAAKKGYGRGLDRLDKGKHQQGKMVKIEGAYRQGREAPPITMAHPYPSPVFRASIMHCIDTCPMLTSVLRATMRAIFEGKFYETIAQENGSHRHAIDTHLYRIRHLMASCDRDCGIPSAERPE